ncbi:type I restriction endonuclease subunit R [Glycomyces sp. L485]|uniref:type I restriction endonuclease subunit R n=1 Tax=Glycomyces sp. L485 TaxID=2909235 RepID=UPI001F4A4548|nr:type I restriction endonuclease subunit R [Glycomyces sp. L485]MCH7231889.1 type I restriction endonuclease subunit R [Glycomyces sp. L485]
MTFLSEAQLESQCMDRLAELGWFTTTGLEIAPGTGERLDWAELYIRPRLRSAIARINPELPDSSVDEAVSKVLTPESADPLAENLRIHKLLTSGIQGIEYIDAGGTPQLPTVHLIDRRDFDKNEFLAVQQVRLIDRDHERRFDIVFYLNGLPISIAELKRPALSDTAIEDAHAQLQTYLREFPLAFSATAYCLIADSTNARYGSVFTPVEHFAAWNVDPDGRAVPQPPPVWSETETALAIDGLYEPTRLIEMLDHYVGFNHDDGKPVKMVAKPHQYFAVSKAISKTVDAVKSDGRAGVVWHTQGSGKSFEMELYTAQIMRHPALGNPTVVVITDRTELDGQLFQGFFGSEFLPEQPQKMSKRSELRMALDRRSGGIIFTTLQKFGRTQDERESGADHPLLSNRRNIVIVVDEAHRSHYDDINGYAKHLKRALPNATMIAFTGTPISETERDTREVFGDYIDIYDLTRAVNDGATVPVYFEPRVIDVDVPDDVAAELDEQATEVLEDLDESEQEKAKQAAAQISAVYGAPDRLRTLAADLVEHWDKRAAAVESELGVRGKAMVVVASRLIAVRLYEEITRLRPDWHDDRLDSGKIKVNISGKPSETELGDYMLRPSQRKALEARVRDPEDELEIVIVKDRMLVGFDAPPLHTLYIDRPLRGALLMQTIARANRTFGVKEEGLMVGYSPLTEHLYKALAEYTVDDQRQRPVGRKTEEAIGHLRDVLHVIGSELLADFDWRGALAKAGKTAYNDAVLGTVNHLRDRANPENDPLDPDEPTLKDRFNQQAQKMVGLWRLTRDADKEPVRKEVEFFHEVRKHMAAYDAQERRATGRAVSAQIEAVLRQMTSSAVEAGDVLDLFTAAGMPRPNLSHLDADFIRRMQEDKHPALAIEALQRLVQQEMRKNVRHNVVRQEELSEKLEALMTRYTNQQLSSAQIIAELVELAKLISAEAERGSELGLTEDELAFYDAVAANEAALNEMGVDKLAAIARDLVKSVRGNLTTDWAKRDDVQANLRLTVKRLLRKHGYPPDGQRAAVKKVIEQVETYAEDWQPEP